MDSDLATYRKLNIWREHHFLKVPYAHYSCLVSGEELEKLASMYIEAGAKPVPLFKPKRYKNGSKLEDRDSSKNSVTYYDKELIWLDEFLKSSINDADSKLGKFGRFVRQDSYEFVRFETGGYIDSHSDSVVEDEIEPKLIDGHYWGRLMTQVVLMGDQGVDFEGGELEIQNAFGFWIKPPFKKKGDVVFFPSILPHRVTEITKGARVSLTTFLSAKYPQIVQDHFKSKKK